jgi:hypothetical protein
MSRASDRKLGGWTELFACGCDDGLARSREDECVFQWWVWWVFAMAMPVFPVAMWSWSAECAGLAFGLSITSPVQGMCMPEPKREQRDSAVQC